ncbi:MAG: class I SAM-dependent methyltransferase [Ignavibacteriales bacterium]|nr:class I SAM-dependent methyltransferase [Ignavibacteriales bacterium]
MNKTVTDLLFDNSKPKQECFYFVDKCPLCNSEKLKILFKQWNINYHKCNNCGFVFSNPRLTDNGAYIWYNSDYYNAAMKTEHYLAENISKYYSISLNEKHFNKFIELFKEFDFSKDTRIADIGCGSGAVLHRLKDELGFTKTNGFDLNNSNIDFARRFRNIEIENVDVYDMGGEQLYDIVITTENIEHVSDPQKYLKQIQKIIKPGGYLLLTTPHNDKLATKLMGLSGDHFCAPNHQNYFNSINLTNLLNQYKFSVLKVWTDNTIKFDVYQFVKRFFVKRDQVTSFPPYNATLKTIWKWNKISDGSVILKKYDSTISFEQNNEVRKREMNFKFLIKNLLKILFRLDLQYIKS